MTELCCWNRCLFQRERSLRQRFFSRRRSFLNFLPFLLSSTQCAARGPFFGVAIWRMFLSLLCLCCYVHCLSFQNLTPHLKGEIPIKTVFTLAVLAVGTVTVNGLQQYSTCRRAHGVLLSLLTFFLSWCEVKIYYCSVAFYHLQSKLLFLGYALVHFMSQEVCKLQMN